MQATLKDPTYLGAISLSGAADLKSILGMMGDSGSSAAYYLVYMAYAIHAGTPEFKPSGRQSVEGGLGSDGRRSALLQCQ